MSFSEQSTIMSGTTAKQSAKIATNMPVEIFALQIRCRDYYLQLSLWAAAAAAALRLAPHGVSDQRIERSGPSSQK
jgi:hypothetical protein